MERIAQSSCTTAPRPAKLTIAQFTFVKEDIAFHNRTISRINIKKQNTTGSTTHESGAQKTYNHAKQIKSIIQQRLAFKYQNIANSHATKPKLIKSTSSPTVTLT